MSLRVPAVPSPGPAALRRFLLLGGLCGLLGTLAAVQPPAQASQREGSTTPTLGEALRPSDSEQLQLTEHLRRIGVLFYGAWWCPACFRQKSLFGQQAGNQLPYVECDKTEAGRERCRGAGIKAYPTWVLGDRRLEGVLTLEQLKRWSGFPASPGTLQP
jgi:hypothetical protein